ncbi:MAG: TlpA disulfide reductase family protein [Firmicutes bacterium]|uniref:Peroxiredoxin n=1 Tax=Melghirimyces thermohalophilus TaxID=1236220 RepID=A0A1G6KAD9_9BACL|nr:TlpA disulfide reductase family protein [Melghirimyces thermohalophilus]MDA8354098.1 TlpA disulfide reductase family protein [Bacillota bacterium]SDC27913.1 Peroxiredoxin [Melghirimyces thermohalophilus]
MSREQAPDFCLPTLNKDQTVCLHDLRGKAVLLSFWVTWCPSCQADLPKKEVFARSLDASRFAFYTINVTGREADPDRVEPFIREHGYRFPVLLDHGRSTYDAYEISSVPTSVLINPEGRIVGRYGEETPFTDVIQDLGRLLG